MEFLSQLWMPILVSGAFVWVASFFMHMVFPHHKKEWEGGHPDEPKLFGALEGVKPGQYMFPYCTMAEMNSPEMKEKFDKGPNGLLYIFPDKFNMGKNLVMTLILYWVIGAFVAYIGWYSMGAGKTYMEVFRVAGAAAFAAHGLGWIGHMIWYRFKGFWANTFDSVVYALVTAGTFGWLWPR